MKIAFCTPFYEMKAHSRYLRSLLESLLYIQKERPDIEFDFWQRDGDAYVYKARNSFANRLIESDFSHLFFIDSDMEWDLQSMGRVLLACVPVVGASYRIKGTSETYTGTIRTNEDRTPVVTPEGLIVASGVATGFCKISRVVFHKMKDASPDDYYMDGDRKVYNFFGHIRENHLEYGEDMSFCLRCLKCEIPMYVEPRCNLGHYGTAAWFGSFHDFLKSQPKVTSVVNRLNASLKESI